MSKCPIVLKPALAVPPSKYPDIVNKTLVVIFIQHVMIVQVCGVKLEIDQITNE